MSVHESAASRYNRPMVVFLAHVLVSAALLLLVANVVKNFDVRDATSAVLAAFVLGLVNAFVRPVAIVLTFPLTILTLGLFLLVVNGLMLKLASSIVPGFDIKGFLPAVWGSILLSIFNLGVEMVFGAGC
jgi:putative membrane protein